jgi:hypothetical protein
MSWFNQRNSEPTPTPAQLHEEFERMLQETVAFGRKAKIRLPQLANDLEHAAGILRAMHAMTAPVDSSLWR